MLLLVILLGIYLRELRTESIYLPIKYPLFRKEGARGRFNYSNLSQINSQISLYKRGAFYDVAFSGFIGNVFEISKSREHLFL